MTKPPIISRRLLLAGFWLAGTSAVWAQVKRGSDQGIGGTGISRESGPASWVCARVDAAASPTDATTAMNKA